MRLIGYKHLRKRLNREKVSNRRRQNLGDPFATGLGTRPTKLLVGVACGEFSLRRSELQPWRVYATRGEMGPARPEWKRQLRWIQPRGRDALLVILEVQAIRHPVVNLRVRQGKATQARALLLSHRRLLLRQRRRLLSQRRVRLLGLLL